ncbi:hypothetical protein GTZ78_12480 [Streptomyces sp. SID8361]|uniref:hypothetical protein n=1 Tax=Streptomyces sp. MnatMP-M27 TaxID=1839768 RepID=UPI00081EDFB9|nr:hypothetical protein [Streptomyces sp. MnatMP-M27]MYU11495.1 hypothetical protein [Streptomyces sp. SID8361]SCF82146.1 hypothetical protein GA0115260_1028912 [Streptomyces sp. MnatMP-M27]
MPVPRLKAAVYVQDPATREELILLPGEEPEPRLAALVTNPDAWEVPPGDRGPEPIAVGEPDPTAEKTVDPGPAEAGGGNAKKPPPRRSRSASVSP